MECSKNSLLYKYVGRFCFLLMEKKECFMSWCSEETRSDEETGFDTTPAPSIERMPVHSLSSYLRFTLPLGLLLLVHQLSSSSLAVQRLRSYSSCSAVTWGQRPGKTMPLPVFDARWQTRFVRVL